MNSLFYYNTHLAHWIQQPIPKLQILNFHEFFHRLFLTKSAIETPKKTCFNWPKKCFYSHSFGIGCWIRYSKINCLFVIFIS